MEAIWNTLPRTARRYILAGDIGGTNANLAIVAEETGGALTTIVRFRHPSPEVADAVELVEAALETALQREPAIRPSLCCLCAAGPVEDNTCAPTNLDWEIDGNAVQEAFGFPTLVLNDFQALCFGLPLLDIEDPDQIIPLPHPDGHVPHDRGNSWAVTGAGTGLGVGLLTRVDDRYVSLPSEGGHSLFAPFDEETEALRRYVAATYEDPPGTEPFLSGRGMATIFNFYRDTGVFSIYNNTLRTIDAATDNEKPPLITRHTSESPECTEVMKLFIKIYARFAGTVALFTLPSAGMYIAGGIVVRHSRLFLKDHLFMRHFVRSYKQNMRQILARMPVYIINDYSISLRGSANAAVSMIGKE